MVQSIQNTERSAAKPDKKLKVTVRYPAAAKPFKDNQADRDETVGGLKQRVLREFQLDQNGDAINYVLFHGRTALDNETQTLGDLAGHDNDLDLKLAQQIIQG